MVAGCLIVPAATAADWYPGVLIALFVIASGVTLLQVAANAARPVGEDGLTPEPTEEFRQVLRQAVMDGDMFQRICMAMPGMAPWVDPAVSEPVGKVIGMGDLHSRWRNLVVNDKPTVLALREIAARRIDNELIDEVEKAERERKEREALEWAAAEVVADEDMSKNDD